MRSQALADQPPPHYHHHSAAKVFVLLTFLTHNSGIVAAGVWRGVYTATDPRPSISDESTLEGFVSLEHFRQTDRQTERGEHRLDKLSLANTQYPN